MATIHDLPNEIIHMLAKRLHTYDRWCLSRASGPLFNALYNRKLAQITRAKLYDMMISPVTLAVADILKSCGYIYNRFRTTVSESADTIKFIFERTYTIEYVKDKESAFNTVATLVVARNMITCRRSISVQCTCLTIDTAQQHYHPNSELKMILRQLMEYELHSRTPF